MRAEGEGREDSAKSGSSVGQVNIKCMLSIWSVYRVDIELTSMRHQCRRLHQGIFNYDESTSIKRHAQKQWFIKVSII